MAAPGSESGPAGTPPSATAAGSGASSHIIPRERQRQGPQDTTCAPVSVYRIGDDHVEKALQFLEEGIIKRLHLNVGEKGGKDTVVIKHLVINGEHYIFIKGPKNKMPEIEGHLKMEMQKAGVDITFQRGDRKDIIEKIARKAHDNVVTSSKYKEKAQEIDALAKSADPADAPKLETARKEMRQIWHTKGAISKKDAELIATTQAKCKEKSGVAQMMDKVRGAFGRN
jgi:predicted nucleic acid-binding protein